MMSDDERKALLDELVAFGTRPKMQPGDVTLAELAEQLGVCRSTAQKRVEPLVASGELLELMVMMPSGHDGIVYRRGKKGEAS